MPSTTSGSCPDEKVEFNKVIANFSKLRQLPESVMADYNRSVRLYDNVIQAGHRLSLIANCRRST